MWKRIIIYIIILIILAGLYLSFMSQTMKDISKKSSPQFQEKAQAEIQAANQSPSFRGPIGPPSVKGPSDSPPIMNNE